MLPLACGAGVGNHITILLALPLVVLPAYQYIRSGFAWRPALLQFLGFAFGLLAYLYLPLAARTHPPINWGDPESIAGFWWLLSGAPYQDLFFNVPLTALNTDAVEPTSHVVGMTAAYREDVVINGPAVEELRANAPARDGDFFKVPKIIE